jgi:hypothetical protein
MTSSGKPKATEQRLDEIRKAAAERRSAVAPPAENPKVQSGESYYGLPVLKGPVWTWEVPLYFIVGGISGVSACIAFAAQLLHRDPALIRFALWMALIGGAICPVLLISDLGRPARFLNMLRVFKFQSAMSLGAWILVAFSNCVLLALVCLELKMRGFSNPLLTPLLWFGECSGAVTGLLLASYTGVLIGATAIPVWSENRIVLPVHFLTSGLGCSSGILELAGFLIPATQIIGFVASGIETLIGILLELRKSRVGAPLYRGESGWTLRIAGIVEGPVALLLRLIAGSTPAGRYAAAGCFLAGALLSRYGWIWAGRVSAHDPHALFQLQRKS